MGKKIDIIILIIFLFLGVTYANFTKGLYVGRSAISGFFLTIPPTIYLSLRKKKNWHKIAISTLLFGGVFGFIFEFIAEFNQSYSVISVLFPFKLFGVLPLDNILGHMMMTLLTIVFYEHFVDREINHHISKNLPHALLPSLFAIVFILFAFFFRQSLIRFSHPYFYMGIAAIIPPIYLGFTRPQFIKSMILTAIYFFFFYFVVEILAVRLRYWIYPGDNYIGWVTVFNTTFPFEELFFWMMFYAASLVSYYELSVDDHDRQ